MKKNFTFSAASLTLGGGVYDKIIIVESYGVFV